MDRWPEVFGSDQAIFMRLRPVHKSAFQCAAIYALTAAEVLR
jgi:hypothetical protein